MNILENKRKFERFPYREAVRYRLFPGQEVKGSLARDFSAGGLSFRAQEFIPIDQEVVLDFEFPDNRFYQVPARVAWIQRVPYSETYHVGVEFRQNFTGASSPEPFPAL